MNAKKQNRLYDKSYRAKKIAENPDYYKKQWKKRKAKHTEEAKLKLKEYRKQYYTNKRKNNPEWVEEQKKKCNEYKRKNYASLKLKQRAYKKTYIGKRAHKISDWKRRNKLKETNERLYYIFDRWNDATNCELCLKQLKPSQKCMEHHHASGHFRNVVCVGCNNFIAKVERNNRKCLLELHRYFIRYMYNES